MLGPLGRLMLLHPIALLCVLGCATSACAQSPAAAPTKPAPASLYAIAVKDLRTTFGLDGGRFLDLPAVPDDAAAARFAEPEWAKSLERAAKEIAMFAQAARLPNADFGIASDPKELAYEELQGHLLQLAKLTAAQGWHHLRARLPAAAAHDAVTLLHHARHVGTQPSRVACMATTDAERHAAALLAEALRDGSGLSDRETERLHAEIDTHLQQRGGRKQLVANLQAEVRHLLTTTLRAGAGQPTARGAGKEPDPVDRFVMDHPVAIADRIEKVVAGWLSPLQLTTDSGLAEALGEVHRRMTAARKASEPKDLAKRLPKMTAEQRLEAVATMLATMMCERPGPWLERERLAAAELRALRQRAADAATGK